MVVDGGLAAVVAYLVIGLVRGFRLGSGPLRGEGWCQSRGGRWERMVGGR